MNERWTAATVGKLARGLALAAAIAAAASGFARAQEPSSLRVDAVSVTTADYPNARAIINVEDASGAEVQLTAADLTATIDGAPVPVLSADLASRQDLPIDVLFVMDVSGSMAGEPISRARDAAKAFVSGLAPADRVAVMAFSDEPRLVLDYTTDRAQALAAIDGLSAAGNTALYAATDEAARKAASSPASRRVAILLSDGAQDGVPLTVTRDQALASAAAAGTPFFAIGEGRTIDREYLQALASVTKGRYLEAPDPGDLNALYASIGKMLSSQYIVTFDASSAQDGSTFGLEIHVAGQTATASAKIRVMPSFAPPPVAVTGLAEAETIVAARTVTADAGARPAPKVTFYLDGVDVAEVTQPPFSYALDPLKLAAGTHTLRVVASDASGAHPAETSLSFTAAPPARKGGGGLPLLPVAAAVVGVLVLALVVAVLLRVRAMRSQDAESSARMLPWAKPVMPPEPPKPEAPEEVEQEAVGEPLGLLISRAGSDFGSEYVVGGSPISIGSGARCGVRVDDPSLGAEEARIWIRKGHLMVHRMTKLTTMVNLGTTGGWAILEPGDTFDIGEHRFEFRLLPAEQPDEPRTDIPNVLRDPDIPRRPAAPGPLPPARFTDLMPRSD